METALDVLSRAATMVQQDSANEARLATKELPTAKWRRDRRLRTTEYHSATNTTAISSPPCTPPPATAVHHVPHTVTAAVNISQPQATASQISLMMAAASAMRPLTESTNRPTSTPSSINNSSVHMNHIQHNHETPIDMSVTSTTIKHRTSPPPPYREPLPGSNYALLARPSVITQAPPKRESILISNRENDNRSNESISMCETVIDEHFRRSLGPDYIALFGKKSPAPTSTPSPQPHTTFVNTPSSTPPIQPVSPHNFGALTLPKTIGNLHSPVGLSTEIKSEPISPLPDKTLIQHMNTKPLRSLSMTQQEPLSLRRSSSPTTAHKIFKCNSPQTTSISKTFDVPNTINNLKESMTPIDMHSNTDFSSPSPRDSPTINSETNVIPADKSSTVVTSSSPSATANVPAVMRIKTEPGFPNATTTPPASPPTSSSNASICNSEVLASVDDHFAKALGDTWKKLQGNK